MPGKGKGGKGGEGRALCPHWRASLGGRLGQTCPWGDVCHLRHWWEGSEGEQAAWEWEQARQERWDAREARAWEEWDEWTYWEGVQEVETQWGCDLREGVEGEWEVEFRTWWNQ